MPIIKCEKCGYVTNTAVSDHVFNENDMADGCYARMTKELEWEKGCSYDDADPIAKKLVDIVLSKKSPSL